MSDSPSYDHDKPSPPPPEEKQDDRAEKRAELADKPVDEQTDEELIITGNMRTIVSVNKPTSETPDRQELDPEKPATEVDPDPTGTDDEVKKADKLRAEGQ